MTPGTTQMISGALFVLIGGLFLRYDGTAGLTGALGWDATELEFELQSWIAQLSGRGLDLWLLGAAGLVLLAVLVVRVRAGATPPSDATPPLQERSLESEGRR